MNPIDAIRGVLSSPLVQGVGGALAFGANPLLGLLAASGIKNSRDRRELNNDVLRQNLATARRRETATSELAGLLSDRTTIQGPGTRAGLLDVEGGDPFGFNLPGRRTQVPTIQTPQGQQQALGLLGRLAPAQTLQGLLNPGTQQFTTPVGKLFNDLELAESRGNTPAARAIQSSIDSQLGPTVNFDDVRSARNDTIKNSQPFLKAQGGFQRVETGFASATPAGDLAGIFGFMKVLDPASTVREGEFANVANSGSVPTRIRNFYNRILSGERLTPPQRADFRSQARAQFEKSVQQQNRLIEEARGFAGRNQLSVEDVVPSFLVPSALPEPVQFDANPNQFELTPAERAELQQLRQEFGL